MTDAELAARLHRDLGALATEAAWSVTQTAGQALGHYTDPIADAKQQCGVSDWSTATEAGVRHVRRIALGLCLDRLDASYAMLVDIKVGEREEKLSQIRAGIAQTRASLLGRVGVGMRLPGRTYPDYAPSDGDAHA